MCGGNVGDCIRCQVVDSIAHLFDNETDDINQEKRDVHLLCDDILFQLCNNSNMTQKE